MAMARFPLETVLELAAGLWVPLVRMGSSAGTIFAMSVGCLTVLSVGASEGDLRCRASRNLLAACARYWRIQLGRGAP